ncbi:hypothetical protein R6Q59_006769 [Mikania micrantha]
MSISKRGSLTPQSPTQPQQDLKHRVITCMNKLSDRDTLAVASSELESIALNLNHDSFAPFLTYLSSTVIIRQITGTKTMRASVRYSLCNSR